jgi:hypothetical protein
MCRHPSARTGEDRKAAICAVSAAQFDCHGFESYALDCSFCRTSLTGVIDPQNDVLLLTAHAPDNTGSVVEFDRSYIVR